MTIIPRSEKAIFTIGYAGRTMADLVDLLVQFRIEFLCDVRSRPASRFFPEFSRAELEFQLPRSGIRYVFMGDTLGGNPDDTSLYSDGFVDYEKLVSSSSFQVGIERLKRSFDLGVRVALMCSERRPESCHRSKAIGVALESADVGIPTYHIDERGDAVGQDAVLKRIRIEKEQLPLFGTIDAAKRSRKTYSPDKLPRKAIREY